MLNRTNKERQILLIGPRLRDRQKPGGAVIAFEDMLRYFASQKIPHEIIDINGNQRMRYLRGVLLLGKVLYRVRRAGMIWLNVSEKGFTHLSPLLFLLCRLFGKKFILRTFGGNNIERYQNRTAWHRAVLSHTSLKADIFFLETHREVQFFTSRGSLTAWFPNPRPPVAVRRNDAPFQSRFVFVSRLHPDKGADLLLDVWPDLPAHYRLEMYGPTDRREYLDSPYYRGVISSGEVARVLAQSDVLLLPTHYPGEGYPGIIIEAYRAGVPVVTTRWNAIPEIVDDHKTGLLIEPKNGMELLIAIQHFTPANYSAFRAAARKKFSAFSSQNVYTEVLKRISEVRVF